MKTSLLYSLLAFLLAGSFGFSQETQTKENIKDVQKAVFSFTKTQEDPKKIGKVVYKIDSEDLQRHKGKSLAEILNTVPGVEMNAANQSFGSNIGQYIRGGRNKNTLIVVDGIPQNEGSRIANNDYDINLIPTENIESIEVLKGGNSALYGSGASAGVIYITTKKNKKNGTSGSLGFSGGSFHTLEQNVSLSGKSNRLNYNFSANNFSTEGISAAQGNDFEKDKGERQNVKIDLGYNLSESISLTGFTKLNQLAYDFDTGAFTDGNVESATNKEFSFGFGGDYKYNRGNLSLKTSRNYFERGSKSAWGESESTSRNYFINLENSVSLDDNVHLLTGVDFNHQNYGTETTSAKDQQFDIIDPYMQLSFEKGNFNLVTAGRINIHSEYDNKFVYSVTPSYLIKNVSEGLDVSLKGSVSNAYITPTLYQLFVDDDFTQKSDGLSPEETLTIESGFSIYLKDILTLNSTFFYREEQNPIDYVSDPVTFIGQYRNTEGLFINKGVEVDFTLNPTKNVELGAAYTFLKMDKNASSIRLPKHKASAFVNVSPIEKTDVTLRYLWSDKRSGAYFDNTTFQTVNTSLEAYHLLDLQVSRELAKNLNAFVSVNNLTDTDYQQTSGYTTFGRNWRAGITYKF